MRKKRHLRKELEDLLWTGFIGGLLRRSKISWGERKLNLK